MQCWTSPSHPPTEHGELPFLHPDQSGFIPIRRGGGLYVDKTGHLRRLLAPVNGDGSQLRTKYAFLARPRRFGKTLLVSTLEAYFQGDLPRLGSSNQAAFDPNAGKQEELFRGTAFEEIVHRIRAHPVVRLNLAMTTVDTPKGRRGHPVSATTRGFRFGACLRSPAEPAA
ncbi:MAG: AAA family ATPase [Caldilineaceae bacterium SB0666_bin_21]|nr:AAA family ATPase [Caldilineaceae bacterium SB0666_bin_21]